MLTLQPNKKYYVFDVDAIWGKTEKALLIELAGSRTKHWFPKSRILGFNQGCNGQLVMEWWLADSNGLLNKLHNGWDVYNYTVWNGQELIDYLERNGLNLK